MKLKDIINLGSSAKLSDDGTSIVVSPMPKTGVIEKLNIVYIGRDGKRYEGSRPFRYNTDTYPVPKDMMKILSISLN